MRRLVALAVVAAAAAIAAAAVPGDMQANPPIRIIKHMTGVAGSGAVALENHGTATITVGSVGYSCGGAMGLMPANGGVPFTIPPSMSHDLVVACPGNLPLGMQRCTFTANDGSGTPLVSFLGACETDGMPVLAPSPASHDFGTVTVGLPSQPFTFSLSNIGTANVALLQLQVDNPSFQIGMPCNPDATGCDAAGVGPMMGSATPITVTCKPVKAGPQAGQLFAIGTNGFFVPLPIALTCTGAAGGGPAISIMPPAIDVGTVEQLGSAAAGSVMLSNTGSGALGITSAQIVDAGVPGAAGDWSRTLSGKCTSVPCNLNTGELLSVDLTFDPSQIGQRGAALLIGYSDGSPKTATVPLDGIGRGATLELVGGQTVIDFGVLPLDMAGQLAVSLKNSGNRTLTDAAAVATPAGPPFTVPATPITVTTTALTSVPVRCQSATAGMFTTMVRISAPDVATLPIDLTLRCEVRDTLLFTDPSSLQLGEIRTGTPVVHHMIDVRSAGAPIVLAGAQLAMANPNLSLTGPTPMTTTAVLDLAVDPTADGRLDDMIVVTPMGGSIEPIAIPISGSVVTASCTAVPELAFGTFCVGQPTTSSIVRLTSTGTATIALSAPAMMQQPSPFDLGFASPTGYPAMLGAGQQASVEVTPKRRLAPGKVDDDLVWTTDVAATPMLRSALHATFIDAGVAIAPTSVGYNPAPIHIDIDNAQQITLRNCDAATIHLGTPDVPAPFSMDSPRLEDFPTQLAAGETTTFGVGFHPTKLGRYEEELRISSPELAMPLIVTLVGEGVTGDGGGGEDDDGRNPDRSSFYACGGCGTDNPSGSIAIAVVCVLVIVAPWRRRRAVPR